MFAFAPRGRAGAVYMGAGLGYTPYGAPISTHGAVILMMTSLLQGRAGLLNFVLVSTLIDRVGSIGQKDLLPDAVRL